MTPEERLKKLHSLAVHGVGGEQKNAQALFEKLSRKYGLEDLVLDEEQISEYSFSCKGKDERKLLMQVAYKVVDDAHLIYEAVSASSGRKLPSTIFVECTAAQKLEIEFLFDFYRRLFAKEKELFFFAFIQKHQLFGAPKSDSQQSKLSQKEIARIAFLQLGMADDAPYKAIEAGRESNM